MTAWQQHQLEQARRQEYLEEVQRRRMQLARQQQLEQERQRERARRERAARLAWQYQQEQKAAAAALEYQRQMEAARVEYHRQVEAYQRRREEFAKRARLASQQEEPKEEPDWERVIPQTLFGVIDLVQHLLGDDTKQEEKSTESKGKEREKTTEELHTEQAKSQPEADKMEVDEVNAKPVEHAQEQAASTSAPEQVVATTAEDAAPAETSTPVQDQTQPSTEEKTEERLLFTYPLPQDEAVRSAIQAKDIGVSFDEASRTIQLIGLWSQGTTSAPSSTAASESGDEGSRGRKRSRSPKRPRVSDVDEVTGEEISKPEEEEEEYVEVPKMQTTITKSIPLPEGVTVDNLRAELTDDGFKVYV